MKDRPIGIFDSGVGGLKIMTAVKKLLPGEDIIYIFDRKHSPYGGRKDGYIVKRAEKVCSLLLARGVKLIIVACNTATAVAIERLRKKFPVPIVGVEPPVRPAVEAAGDGKVLLACTKATARQKRVAELIKRYGSGKVVLAPMPTLATLIEQRFSDLSSLTGEVETLLAPYDGEDIKAVALGCTHYYHIKGLIEKRYEGKVPVLSGEEGVARRVSDVLEEKNLLSQRKIGRIKYVYL